MAPSLTDRIIAEFPRMPERLQAAARFVLDQPQDVALLTMREQARRAGVPPATMTRLAQRLGLDGYEDVRRTFAAAVRKSAIGYGAKASELVTQHRAGGAQPLVAEMAEALARHVGALAEPATAAQFAAAAADLVKMRHIYCLGLRSSFPVAYTFHYICALAGRPVTLLEAAGGTGLDALAAATDADGLVVTSVRPYTRATVEAARQADARGLSLVVITDSRVSPLAAIARHMIVVGTGSPSFFDAKTAALAAAEILAMLVAVRAGDDALAAVKAREHYLTAINAYWRPPARRSPR